jgi:hypothetical protein
LTSVSPLSTSKIYLSLFLCFSFSEIHIRWGFETTLNIASANRLRIVCINGDVRRRFVESFDGLLVAFFEIYPIIVR